MSLALGLTDSSLKRTPSHPSEAKLPRLEGLLGKGKGKKWYQTNNDSPEIETSL